MSDLGRKNLSDKVSEAVTPNSQKTTLESAKESVTGAADKVAAAVTPESEKSFSQSLADKAQSGHDQAAAETAPGIVETAGEYLEAAKVQIGHAVENISATLTGAVEGAHAGAAHTDANATKK
ncbi:hypothetical protein BABINDRAFT_42595 [Babjeviella inositovora NRRL Y-12698]|uniref:Uncharacterized protein n=1 Tax=Babjeviella inositovora NRRL Y-12698 TaxID=984486 RepID=A0A1E3QIY4_9ASCO|nr:uncharacterized protein BABINDRAFT_42595 [Babjeviella inositovora NRRL Y-12698]ODQ76937.1 hypothetical protein BABINDRAFT_42595 [Babjeviella inositovora NRRL Y-12698]